MFQSKFLYFLIILIAVINCITSQESDEISSKCILQNSCNDCLLADKLCAWCTDPDYGMVWPRCMIQTEMYKSACKRDMVLVTENIAPKYTENKELKDFVKDDLNVVQIQPQKIDLVLQKTIPKQIKFKYKPAKNYPLDLYFLMDLTYTMADDKETLIGMSEFISKALHNLTENYRLGFGSFIEKPVMPFIMMEKQQNPCSVMHETCSPTYDFWHQLSLTENITKFIDQVRLAKTSANMDNIEAGFDALMQILVCDKDIGWSDKSRKIIVYATDGGIHFAGDGKLAGIVDRNDKQCHLNADGKYTQALNMDYPSVEEMYRVLVEKKSRVIFAVTDIAEYFFDKLHNLMIDVSNIELLKDDSSNILDLINRGYQKFIETVQFLDNAPDYILVKYQSTCGGMYSTLRQVNRCDQVESGKEYEFIVTLELLDFPDNASEYNQVIKIEEASIRSEMLELNVKIEKPCKCLETEIGQPKSKLCNEHGKFQCGSCHCDEFWTGKQCNCNLRDYSNYREVENLCRKPTGDEPSYLICSDKGECLCGECMCNTGFVGKYCECPECPKINGYECGGSEHATCNCGQCECNYGWTGYSCSCSTSTEFCKPQHIKQENDTRLELCSGRGICECGECVCQQNYFGKFCESRKGFEENELCEFYNPCVECMINIKNRMECENKTDVCQDRTGLQYLAEFFDSLPRDNPNICYYRMQSKLFDRICEHKFSYLIDENWRTQLRIVYDPCESANVAMVALFGFVMIFVAILLLGLMIICCIKMRNTVLDKREYARFQEELSHETAREMSPIYKSPIVRYEMPRMSHNEEDFEMR